MRQPVSCDVAAICSLLSFIFTVNELTLLKEQVLWRHSYVDDVPFSENRYKLEAVAPVISIIN